MKAFCEDSRVKIPCILHLVRLGYRYLSLKNAVWDEETNIFPDLFRSAIEKINPGINRDDIERLLADVQLTLENEDLGKAFYEKLTERSGTRLIDFTDFSNNSFHVVTELPCKNGDDEFRPDITLLINGMPLAFVEVKKPNNREGVLAERNRIITRSRNPRFRRFINITQLMVFSNNMEYEDGSPQPIEGAFYASPSYDAPIFNYFREEEDLNLTDLLADEDDAVENEVLRDNNLNVIKHSPEFISNKTPQTPTNRICTSLFSRERLSFLLQYALVYVNEADGLHKHVMRYPQLFATKAIERKLDAGVRKGIIWHTQGSGKTALAYYNTRFLTDYYQRRGIIPKFYFIVDRLDLLIQAQREFSGRGLTVHTIDTREAFALDIKAIQALHNFSGRPEITVVNIQKFQDDPDVVRTEDYDVNVQRVYFLDEVHRSYNPKGSFLANLSQSDRNAIKIGLTGTPLLGDDYNSRALFGDYIHKYYYNASIADGYTLRLIREEIATNYKLSLQEALAACFPAEGEGEKKNDIYLTLPGEFQGRTTLMLQQTKQKAFFLQGHGGLDLLDNIETQIRSVSSERRLMPSPGRLETMASAKVLTAAGQASEEADTLRRADGLSVRRLGWAIQLRAVETLARDLRQNDWKEERAKFYQFAHSHILRPDKILDHVDYLPRLLSLAVALMDWAEARKLVDATIYSLRELEAKIDGTKVKVNGQPASGVDENAWSSLRASVLELAADAIARSLRWSQRDGGPRPLSETALDLCKLVGLGTNIDEIYALSLALRESDWAKTPYKDHLRRDASRQRSALEQEAQLYGLYVHEGDLHEFLLLSGASDNGSAAVRVNPRCKQIAPDSTAPSLLPYLFPTRPYSTQDISLFLPDQCVFVGEEPNSARAWARYVRAVRGVWVWGSLVTDQFDFGSATPPQHPEQKEKPKGKIAVLGAARKGEKIRLGISSLLTTEDSWRACADGRPDISRERYARIERLINQAISAYPKPTHLLLPELSLPDRWVDTVSGLLLDAGISLVAGLDYHRRFPNWIHSEAVLVLADDRLGFPASVQIRQPKSMPAAAEEERLLKDYGQKWADTLKDVEKPVYQHQGFCFGVLVCSELQNVNHRLRFQGDIDCMIVLSWNQDLETFSALVESASLDVHAHIALVNNRKYGDSRVRSPSKANHGRDLCRLRGGQNEHVVVVELDVETLRAFQSRATRWPRDDDPFKPVPEGYVMAKYRRTTPE